jgi:hypothetical protein
VDEGGTSQDARTTHIDPGSDDADNESLVRAVPGEARRVLQIGSARGWLADALKAAAPGRAVYGVSGPAGTPADGQAFDGVFDVDVERAVPPLPPGSVECLVLADVLPRVADPLSLIRRCQPLLTDGATICASVPNLQHHSVVTELVRGSFPYRPRSLLDPGYVHLFTAASVIDLLLDAGYAPGVVDRVMCPGPEAIVVAGTPMFELLGVGAKDAERDLSTAHLVVRAEPLAPVAPGPEPSLTFVACVNDDAQLEANLARSPCFRSEGPHELLVFRGCATAAEGLNAGIERARGDFVVLVHQDVYVPDQWPRRMGAQWRLAESAGGPIGIAGVFGVLDRTVPFDAIGRVVHRDRLLAHRTLPADVDGLDELLMVVPRSTPLRADPSLGWHLYGTDLALAAQRAGSRVVVLDAPCHHNSLTGRVPATYRDSERVLARKWREQLPIHTNLSSIDAWLLDTPGTVNGSDSGDGPDGVGADGDTSPAAIAELVARLRDEQAVLNVELERARLQVASMKASPFWRAREVFAALRDKIARRG